MGPFSKRFHVSAALILGAMVSQFGVAQEVQNQNGPQEGEQPRVTVGGGGRSETISFGDERVTGQLDNPGETLRLTRIPHQQIECLDRQRSALQSSDPARVREGFRASLRCLYDECVSDSDANFLMECGGTNRMIQEMFATPAVTGDAEAEARAAAERFRLITDPTRGNACRFQDLVDAVQDGRFVGLRRGSQPGTCERPGRAITETFTLANRLDLVLMIDNSDGMYPEGHRAVTAVFPEIVEAARNLRQDVRVILMTQNMRNVDADRPVVLSASSPEFVTQARQAVDRFFADMIQRRPWTFDLDERHLQSLHHWLVAPRASQSPDQRLIRDDSDVMVVVLTDEYDNTRPERYSSLMQELSQQVKGSLTIVASNPSQASRQLNTEMGAAYRQENSYRSLDVLPRMTQATNGRMFDLTAEALRSELVGRMRDYANARTVRREISLRHFLSGTENPAGAFVQWVMVNGVQLAATDYTSGVRPGGQVSYVSLAPHVIDPSRSSQVMVRLNSAMDAATARQVALRYLDDPNQGRPTGDPFSRIQGQPRATAPSDLGARLTGLNATNLQAFMDWLVSLPADGSVAPYDQRAAALEAMSNSQARMISRIRLNARSASAALMAEQELFNAYALLTANARSLGAPRGSCLGLVRNQRVSAFLSGLSVEDARPELKTKVQEVLMRRLLPEVTACMQTQQGSSSQR